MGVGFWAELTVKHAKLFSRSFLTETLLPILIEHIHPERTIYSDCWRAYSRINRHFMVHNSLLLIIAKNSSIMKILKFIQTIESHWRILKRNVLPSNGTSKGLYESYFTMHCFKRSYLSEKKCIFKGFLDLIKCVYLLNSLKSTPFKSTDKENKCKASNTQKRGTESSNKNERTFKALNIYVF